MPKNLRDHVSLATPTSETFVRGHVGTIPGNTPAKFEVRTFSRFGTTGFNAQKFTGSRDRDHAHFFETFVRYHVGTMPGNTPAKFEVSIFSHFETIRTLFINLYIYLANMTA